MRNLRSDDQPRRTVLPSGLTVVTQRMPHVETVSVGVHAATGSRAERPDEHGLAHFLEHMAFKGTATRSAQAIAEEIEAVGGDINAATGVESTAFHARVLGEDLPLALDILGDILTRSVFSPDEIEREKGVVLQEIAAVSDTPDDLVFDVFTDVAFGGAAIGRPILGTNETVSSFDATALRGFLAREYTSSHVVVSAAGALDHDRVVEIADEALAELPAGRPVAAGRGAYRGGERRLQRRLEQAHVVLGFEAPSYLDPNYFAAQVFSGLVGGGMSSRLFQEVREKRGLAYAVHTMMWSYADTGLLGLYLGIDGRSLAEGIDVSLDCLAAAAAAPDEREVARAKAQLKVSLLMALESSGARAEQMARHLFAHGRLIPTAELVALIDAVDVRAVRSAARAMLSSPATVVGIGPVKGLPDAGAIGRRLAPPALAAE